MRWGYIPCMWRRRMIKTCWPWRNACTPGRMILAWLPWVKSAWIFFVPDHNAPAQRARQEIFYAHQLGLARQFGLPVLLHGRKSQDVLLKYLRRQSPIGGIAHAFNGSFQQAHQFLDLGFSLGMGGALTFDRALQIRRLATQLPIGALVLETDAPDMAPAWLGRDAQGHAQPARNEPAEIAGVADCLASLRGEARAAVIGQCAANAQRSLPRLALVQPI